MSGSVIQILYNGTNITNNCIIERCSFESQLNAVPGTCELTVKDENESLSFTTGKEIVFTVDGTRLWAGFLVQIVRTHAFPADDTVGDYNNRLWILRGVDYNILFDKRIFRNPADYLNAITYPGSTMDGALLKAATSSYSDLTNEFDTSQIENVAAINQWYPNKNYAIEQGSYLRTTFEDLAKYRGQIYYIDASKRVHFHSLERVVSKWGFSDQPNYASITASGSGYQNATYGFREFEAVEDGSLMINDAFIWGGSAIAGGGSVFVGHKTNSTSISTHGRWQYAENRIGDLGIQAAVDARADSLVNGPPGTDAYGQQKGLSAAQWTFTFSWFAHNVPSISGVKQHLTPGQLVTIEANVFGITRLLPLRTVRTSFPSGVADGTAYVQFTGEFGLQLSDPFTLWAMLMSADSKPVQTVTVTAVSNSSTATVAGAYGDFTPTPAPDGSTTLFTIPFGYIAGTLQVKLNGLEQRSGIDFNETDPSAGTFTTTSTLLSTDTLDVRCRTLAS